MPGTVEENDYHKLEGISEHISDELSGGDERDDGGKIADSGEKFDFTLWTKNCGINRKTAALLSKEDLVTIEALVVLDDGDGFARPRNANWTTYIISICIYLEDNKL